MDNQRLILWLALSFVIILLWGEWQERNAPVQPQIAVSETGVPLPPSAPTSPMMEDAQTPDIPTASTAPAEPIAPAPAARRSGSQRVHVVTDVLDVELDTLGGDLRKALLLTYPVSIDTPDNPFPLMGDKLPQHFVAQSGLLSKGKAPSPSHHSQYTVESTEFRLAEGADELKVPMTWKQEGIKVTKIYTFKRDSYLVKVEHVIENGSDKVWSGRQYRQLERMEYDSPGKSRLLYTFTGGAFSSEQKPYEKVEFDEMAEWRAEQSFTKGGWVAMLEHYFVTAWVPAKNDVNHFYSQVKDSTLYRVGMSSDEVAVEPGQSLTLATDLFVGPKEQKRLEAVADNLKLTVDYGIASLIAEPLYWILEWLKNMIGNWGWAIILLTLLIKLAFYKLSEASYRSMANMRRMAPKFKAIRERYGDDRQRMSQAFMELYKKEKVNPMSGCWPILVQIPVFLALYWMLLESVELRQAPWILWIEDLSAKDPFYVLPLLMGASMFIQQKLNQNPSLDPMHQKILTYMPLVFTAFFMLFPAGLVLYWVVNNVLSILQQWYITRKIEGAAK